MKSHGHRTSEVDAVLKLLLLGDGAVGKSSLLLRYCENKFDHKHLVTIGVDFKSKVVHIGSEKIRLQIWDTAGQERFRNITPVYFRSAQGVVLVFDVTSVQSFEDVSFWLDSLAKHAGHDMCRVIVGNKIDLAHRQVSRRRAEALAARHDIQYFETSALNNIGISEVFETLAIQIRAQQKHEHKSDSKIDKSKFRLEASSDYVEGSIYNATNSNVCCGYNLRKLSESFSTRSKQPSIALEEVAESESSQQSTDCASPAKKGDMSKTKIQKNPIFITTESPIDQAPIQSPQNLLEIHDKVRRTLKIQDHTMLRMPSKINEANDYGKRVSRRSDTCLTIPNP